MVLPPALAFPSHICTVCMCCFSLGADTLGFAVHTWAGLGLSWPYTAGRAASLGRGFTPEQTQVLLCGQGPGDGFTAEH